MSDYARFRSLFEYSSNSDYSRPMYQRAVDLALTPDEVVTRRLEVTDSATTYDIDEFATVTSMFVYNGHASIALNVTWTSSLAASQISIPAGQFALIPDVDPATDPTFALASSGTGSMDLIVTGT